jgi:hypothetical protein
MGAVAGLAGAGSFSNAGAQAVPWPTHGWRRSSPEAQGMDSRLAGAFDYTRERKVPIRRTPTTTGWREAMTSSWQERRRPFVCRPAHRAVR